jgi:hypothetical protein
MLQKLDVAYTVYKEVLGNLEEALKVDIPGHSQIFRRDAKMRL